MDNALELLLLVTEILPEIGIFLILWGIVDNYFLTRYGGKLNRGFTMWSQPLKPDEAQFLLNLKEDIVDINKRRIGLRTIIKTSFIAVKNGEALIRFARIGQRTSWPMVGYVDLSSPEPMMEYRLSLPILLGTIFILFVNVIVVAILSVAFLFSWLFEIGGLKNYLSQKADVYLARQISQKGIS